MRESTEPDDELWGLGRWLDDESYGTWKDDLLKSIPPVKRSNRGIRRERVFTGDALNTLRDASIDEFVKRIQNWPEQRMLTLASKS